MERLTMQQLCSFVTDDKKYSDKFVLLKAGDIMTLVKYYMIGYRILLLVERGEVDVTVNGRSYRLVEHDYLDILDGTLCRFSSVSSDAELYCMIVTMDFLVDSLRDVVPGPPNYLFKVVMNPIMRMNAADASVMWRQMRMLDGAMSETAHYYRAEMIKLYFKSFILEFGNILFHEQGWQIPEQSLAKRDLLMSDFMNLVWEHFKEKREVSFYAKELCVSAKHLSRVVKSATGYTPHEIISREVMGLAMQLLRNEGIMVQQISDILHFADQAAFSKFFKKYMNMSPSEYRRNF